MAELYRYTLQKEARSLYLSVHEKSAPTLENGQKGELKFSGTWGIEKADFDAIVQIMVDAIKAELGSFGNPSDYFLACMSGKTAAKRVREAAAFKASKPGLNSDDVFKIKEKAEKRAALYEQFAGVLSASSKYDVSLAQMVAGKIVDIEGEHNIAKAGKDLFYPGSFTVPSIALKAFRRKTMDAKDGCTAYLQNCLFLRKGERIAGGSGPANNEVFGSFQGYSSVDPTAGAPDNASAGFSEGEDAF
uniref:DUF2815 family protein n=1 Tax=Mycena chlorophos TaxID=658473 RepID=A0ABQ0KTZ3_MYCCL|nr:predicted protein [Mycena chlorophos]